MSKWVNGRARAIYGRPWKAVHATVWPPIMRVGDSSEYKFWRQIKPTSFRFQGSDTMAYYIFTIFSGIGFLLSILTAYVIYKSPNSPWAAMILVGWILSWNFLFFVDSIIWSDSNPADWWDGNIYCDINSRIKDAIMPGIPGATIGVLRFLANTMEQHVSQRAYNIFENNLVDFSLGVVFPIVITAVRLVAMPCRYQIWGVFGCTGIIDDSWPSILVWYLWPPVLSLVSALYAGSTSL